MIFAILTLVSALSISCIAAYFSIIGLATIFPGSMGAVIGMGAALEIGKIIAAIWLHNNWSSAPRMIKIYLFSAILILMGITSMGIFGFLSKSHIEHQNNAEKNIALAEQVEKKIERENQFILRQKELIGQTEDSNQNLSDKSQENIKLEQQKIDQLNSQLEKDIALDSKMLIPIQSRIDQLNKDLNEVKNKPGGLFSNKTKEIEKITLEQSQERQELSSKKSEIESRISKYRNETSELISSIRKRIQEYQSIGFDKPDEVKNKIEEYNQKISESLNRIDELEKEKFNYDDGSRQLEAEVGPVKYVAELISDFTGVEFDMGKAVRIVIIILIFVFDPLAVLLVLAAHISLLRYFPQSQINEKDVIQKTLDLKIQQNSLNEKESELMSRQKNLDQEEEIIKLKEDQIKKYKEDVDLYQEKSREYKIQAEKNKMLLEENQPIINDIKDLKRRRDKLKDNIDKLSNEKLIIIDKEKNIQACATKIKEVFSNHKDQKNDVKQIKAVIENYRNHIKDIKLQINELTAENNKLKEINENQAGEIKNIKTSEMAIDKAKEKEINSLRQDIESLKLKNSEMKTELQNDQVDLLKEKISQLVTQKNTLIEEKIKNASDSKNIIIKHQAGTTFCLKVPSKHVGFHSFTKQHDFTAQQISNMISISTEIDLHENKADSQKFMELFDLKIKKFYDPKIDNRQLKIERPLYSFIS